MLTYCALSTKSGQAVTTYNVSTQKGVEQMKGQTEYLFEKTIEFSNFKANIFRPVLTEQEKSKLPLFQKKSLVAVKEHLKITL